MRSVLHKTPCTYRQPLPMFPRSLRLHIGMCSRRSSNGLIPPAYARFHPSCCWTKIASPVPLCNSPFYIHSRLLCHEHYLPIPGHPTTPRYPFANAPAKCATATYHRYNIINDCPKRQNRGCGRQAHHQGCGAPPHIIIPYCPRTIQLGLPPLQMIPQHRPTYDWCNPSIKVKTRLPSWKNAFRTMKMKTLQTT
jgi:hypothetical protein